MTAAEPRSDRQRNLAEAVRRYDTRMRELTDLGIDLHRPPRELLADLQARRDERRRRHEALEQMRRDADRSLLPELLDLYITGGEADRAFLRDLLRQCPTFRWGFGWGLAERIAGDTDARNALAVFSMKDGGADPRDQIVALDRLCAAIGRAGLPPAPLLTEGASWSSDVARFANFRSTRDLLLGRAGRFGSASP